jgi:hypothetical protein
MFPQINGQVKAALRWYDDETLLTRYSRACKSESTDCPFAASFVNGFILPFQFQAGTGTVTITEWKLRNINTGLITPLDSFISLLRVDQLANPTRTYITLEQPFDTSINFFTATLEMVITTNNGTYYSETFKGCGTEEEMDACHFTLKWRSCGDVGTLKYTDNTFENILHLSNDRADVNRPTPEFSEETEDTADGGKVVVQNRRENRWNLKIADVPWYTLDALAEMVLHDQVKLRVPGNSDFDTISNLEMSITWVSDCRATVDITFTADDATTVGGCCETADISCPTSCGSTDGIWNEGDANPEIGTVHLLEDGTIGTYYSTGQSEVPVDVNGFAPEPCLTRFALVGGVAYQYDGTEWVPAITLDDVFVDETTITVTGTAMEGFGVLIQYSDDGVTWYDAMEAASPQEFAEGLLVDYDALAIAVRARLIGDECVVGTSSPSGLCGCDGATLTVYGALEMTEANGSVGSSLGLFNGKVYYSANNRAVSWADGAWGISVVGQDGYYVSQDDTTLPCQARNWFYVEPGVVNYGDQPEPVFLCGGTPA